MTKPSISKEAQRERLLNALREHGEISTDDCRSVYHSMSPASRVMELRKQGHSIDTVFRHVEDSHGVVHRMGVYALRVEGTDHAL
jgi:hypothetical protein